MESILRFKRDSKDDFYSLLQCDEHSAVEQIMAEYKILALKHHPDKNPNDEESFKKFQLIQKAKEVLTDPEKRKNYDKWRHSGLAISYQDWLNQKDKVHTTMHWAVPKTEGRMLESDKPKSEELTQIRWGPRDEVWSSDNNDQIKRKFRNYQI